MFDNFRGAHTARRFEKAGGENRPARGGRSPAARYRIPVFELLELRELLTGNTFTPALSVADSASAADNNLRSAIAAVNADASGSGSDTIQLSSGTYTLSLGELQITNTAQTITIVGQGSTGPGATIIDQTALDRVFQINSGVTVILKDLEITGGTATNDGFGSSVNAEGGGILSHGNLTLTNVAVIDNEALNTGAAGASGAASSTTATAEGGGIYSDGSLTIQGTAPGASLIENNSATIAANAGANFGGNASGGGVFSGYNEGYFLTASQFQITGTTIADNTAQAGVGSFAAGAAGGQGGDANGGGADLSAGASSLLSDDTIEGNQAIGGAGGTGDTDENGGQGGSGNGGGVAFTGPTAYVLYGPIAFDSQTAAASIDASGSTGALFSDDTFSGNTAQGGAGGNGGTGASAGIGGDGQGGAVSTFGQGDAGGTYGYAYSFAALNLSNDTLYGNNALGGNGSVAGSASGGGIDNSIAWLAISSSTITANTAQAGTPTAGGTSGTATGGGIENDYAPQAIPQADGYYYGTGFGISYLFESATLTIDNTLDSGNTAAIAPDFDGAATSTDHNLIGDGTDATGFSAADGDQVGTSAAPIAPLLGPLQNSGGSTATVALLPGSPALAAGDPAAANSAGLSTDQRGLPRIVAGAVDVGAFETQQPDGLEITTTDSQGGSSLNGVTGTATPGTAITYTIVVSNTGPNSVTGASIVDALPSSLTGATYTAVASGGATGFAASGTGSIDDTDVDLPIGSTITYTVEANVASSATGTLSNTATVTPPAGATGTGTATDTDTLTPQSPLQIATSDNRGGWAQANENGTVAPGQTITYTISVSNAGPSDAVGVSIVDSLPSSLTGATFTAVATGGATGFTASGSGSIDDTDVDLPGYSTITYTVEATVASSATGTVSITTNATAPVPSGANPDSVSATDTDNIVVPTGLSITETDSAGGSSITGTSGTILAGNSITYTVVVSNLGPGDQSGVGVLIPTPYELTGATYTATATGGATGFSASGTGRVDDSGIDMPAGSTITYTVTATVPVEVPSYFNNTVYVSSPSTASQPYDENDWADDGDQVTQPPHLEITNSSVSSGVPGQAITYTVTVTNPTASTVTAASVVDPLPGTLTGATYTATETGGAAGFTSSGTGSIDDTDVDMPAGSTITYTVTATIASSATGTLSSTATVTKLPGATVNSSLVTGLNDPQGIAASGDDLFVVNTATGAVGEYTTAGAVVNAALITGLTDPEGIAISGGDIFVTSVGSSYRGTGSIGEYTLAGAVVNAALITGLNSPVGIAASGDDLYVTDDYFGGVGEYTTSGTVVNASLVTGCGAAVGVAVLGGDLFVASNQGDIGEYDSTTGAAVNASLVDTQSSGITASDGDLFFTRSDGTIGELTPSGAIVDPAVVTGLSGPEGIVVSGGNLFVTLPGGTSAGVGTIAEYAVGNNSASATNTDTLTPQSNITITKTDNLGGSSVTGAAGTATPGQAITYTIVVSNTGPSDAIAESVVDPLPSTLVGATYTATATGGASGFTASGTGNIDDTDLDLPAGSTITYIVQATVSQAASGTLSNTATVTEPATTLISSSFVTGLDDTGAVVVSGGDLFVVNGNTIGLYNATAGATINASLVTGPGYGYPLQIAVSGGDLFVTNNQVGTIGEYDATTGATINASLVSGLTNLGAIAVSGGDLFVTSNSGTIAEYDATTGATINASLVSGLSGVSGIAVSGGDLFVANSFPGVDDYSNDYGTIGQYNATTGATINASLITGLSYPGEIEVSGGNLYVGSNDSIGEYTLSGATINAALVAGSNGSFAVSSGIVLVAHFEPQVVYAEPLLVIGDPFIPYNTGGIYEYATVTASATDTVAVAPAISSLAVPLPPTQTVDLSSAFNLTGITTSGAKFGRGLDGQGNALGESNVGTSQTWNGVGFVIAPAGTNNVVQAAAQTITLPTGSFSSVDLLATGVNGNQANQTFTITYTDGSSTTIVQSISDWHMPQGYAGESIALSTPYRNQSGGGRDNAGPFDVYGYSLAVDSTKTVATITLPSDHNVEILAITVVAPVAAPTSLTVAAASSTEADVSWTAATGTITGYNVYRGTAAGGESAMPLNSSPLAATATSFADTTAVAGNTYFYVVRAIDAPAVSSASNEASVTMPAAGAAIQVDLAGDYNLAGISAAGTHFAGGLDGHGNDLSATALGTSQTAGGVTFAIAPAGASNVIQAAGQTLALPQGSYSQIDLLATGVNGNQVSQAFTVHYTDGTSAVIIQSISDWHMPQSYAGEAVAVSTSSRNTSIGGADNHGPFDVYGYSLTVDNTKTIASITLPANQNVDVLAITAVT